MTEHEKHIIKESIDAYQRMINNFQLKITQLNYKLQTKCCFEKNTNHEFKIKRAP